jgi:predicted Zn finger-like uncharacterized protein
MVDEDLEPLITRCPNCSTQFRVTESQLAAAGGRVRCGACLTVFEGTEHLILDEDSTFSDGLEADAALDALLDELGTTEGAQCEAVREEREVEEQALTQDAPVIYGGFEDEPAEEVAEAVGADPLRSADFEPLTVPPGAEQKTEEEAGGPFDAQPEDQVPSEGDAPPKGDGPPAERAPLQDDAAPEELDSAARLEDADEAEAEAEQALETAAAAAEEVSTGSELDEDYKAWIRPGTPDIEQLVDEVVHSGVAAKAEPPETTNEEEPEPAAAAAEDGFHLSALEKALEEEGVGTAPISFAPEPRRWWVVGLAALLSLLLAAQIFYLQLPQWSRDPGTRGIYETVCGLFGCELPEIRAVDRLRTRNLMVRSHPDLENILVIDAVIVNQADFPQRFPGLELKFTSVGGLLVAGRSFKPEEYLGGEINAGDLMPVNTPVQVSLEIADPGQEAVNYTLSFR